MSDTCCPSVAPKVNVEVEYTPKGTYETYADFKTYVTGPKDAKRAVFVVYDIFGFFPQTLQGADILSKALDALVVIPDFFQGEPCDFNLFPPDTEEKKEALGKFWEAKADFFTTQDAIRTSAAALKEGFKSVEKWAIIGYCWGGKMAVLASAKDTPFDASVQIHPAFVSADDVFPITIPHFLYASADEPVDAVSKFKGVLASHPNAVVREKSVVETRTDAYHGWMGARAKLNEEKYRQAYQEGYEKVAEFLSKNL